MACLLNNDSIKINVYLMSRVQDFPDWMKLFCESGGVDDDNTEHDVDEEGRGDEVGGGGYHDNNADHEPGKGLVIGNSDDAK